MKIFGTITELLNLVYRKDSQNVTLRPNQTTTYTAARDIQLPPGDTAHVILSATSTQTITNKIIDGGTNTLNNINEASLATVALDADKVLARDGSGAVVSAKIVNANVATSAAIAATKLADGSVDNTEFQRLGTAGTNATGELVTTDGTQLLQNKTIDGDENTVQDLPVTALKTVLGDADEVILRNASGVPISAKIVNVNVDAAAAIAATKIADGSVDNTEFQKLGTAGTAGSGNLVTTDDIQVITAKDIDGGTASNTSRITVPKASTATLAALTRKEGTIAYDTTLDALVVDDGSAFIAPSGGGSDDPTTMSDVVASRLGYKEYLDGILYNGALFTVTASSGTVALGRAVVYQNQNGDWNFRFAVRVTGATNGTTVTFSDVDTAFEQGISCSTDGLAPDYANGFGFCGTNNIFYAYTAAGTGTVYLSGDVVLNSKPNWAY